MEEIEKLMVLGLSRKSAAAYVALLRLQNASATQIAREAKIERTTIYKVLEELVQRGLASKSSSGKRITFIAEAPNQLKRTWEKQGSILETILPSLIAIQGKQGAKPTVKFYENIDGIRQALNDSLNAKDKLRRDFASVENVIAFLGKRFITHQIDQRVAKGIHVRSLRTAPKGSRVSETEWYLRKSNREVLREVRYLNEKIDFAPLIVVYDNTVLIISSQQESYALVINSAELAQAMKVLFDVAWQQAKK